MPFLLLVFALMFLGSIGYLIKNAAAVAEMFGKRRGEAEPGDLVTGPQRARRASHPAIYTALGIHLLGLIGLIAVATMMIANMSARHPAGLPAEMNPVEAPAK